MSFAAAGGELGAFQYAADGTAVGFVVELHDHAHPVIEVGRAVSLPNIEESSEVGNEALIFADQDAAIVDAVGKHVAHFARAGEFFHLPPAKIAIVPILESSGTK